MNNKKLLVATYYWPPSGGAAVQRWLSFANKLCEEGWQVHILTVSPKWATYQLQDQSLVAQIDPRIIVHTTKTLEPFGIYKKIFGKDSIPKPAFSNETSPSLLKKAFRFIRGNFFIPDPRIGWKKYAVPKANKVIEEHEIATIITAGPPHSTHFIGKELKRKTNIKWIADFHDLWTDVIYYNMLYHTPIIKQWDKRLERSILENADHIITVGEKYKEKLLSKSGSLTSEKISVLRIGYDEKAVAVQTTVTKQNAFIITYTGSIADFYQPEVFIACLREILSTYPHVPFILRFVGVLSAGIKALIIDAGLESYLEETGYVSHAESISFLIASTVLLLVNPVTKDEEMVIPGKLYEYLAAQKPIINITSSKAETASIIAECNAGRTFERTQKNELMDYMKGLITLWINDKNIDIPPSGCTSIYSRKEITKRLIDVIETQ
jgi:glycosyltransferase involved in cell wall biosynthesis